MEITGKVADTTTEFSNVFASAAEVLSSPCVVFNYLADRTDFEL